jgi:stage II sporulation protein AA (anti-sigma F factor antagonist)
MGTATEVFEVEHLDGTVILTPSIDLRELDFRAIESAAHDVFDSLEAEGWENVILDFHRTDYYGTTALGFFVGLWKRVRSRGGRMAFCNVSRHETEVLRVTRLDRLWPICQSRDEALTAVSRAPCVTAPTSAACCN